MNRRLTLLALASLVYPCAQSQEPDPGEYLGFVTRAASGSDFDLNGAHVLCGPNTKIKPTSLGSPDKGCLQSTPYIGEQLFILGPWDSSMNGIVAKRITIENQKFGDISGSAVIDSLPPRNSEDKSQILVRADGYLIRITSNTATTFDPALHSLTDVQPGVWIEYKGTWLKDGFVVAKEAKLTPNQVSHGEEKLREKKDYDPASVPADSKQSLLSKGIIGIDPKQIPPYFDEAKQARIDAIGQKLIPAYQRDLPDSDTAKINFRFQLIDGQRLHNALTLPSGVILIPFQILDRLQNDSQLAAVLADNIATALEKQDYRLMSPRRSFRASEIAADVAGSFVPFGSIPAIPLGMRADDLKHKAEDQSGRVSLGLLHDAGYDIDEAPKAWWLLSADKPQPLVQLALPDRAAHLYQILGKTWHNPEAAAAPVH